MKTYNHPLNSISKLVHSANNSNPLSLTKALNESLMAEPNWLATVRESMENTNFILKTLEQPNSIGELAHAAINSNPLSKLKALNESLMPKSNLLAAVRDSRENTNLILKSFEQANSIGELANAAINSNPLSKLKALNESLMPKSNLLAAVRESRENTNLILKSFEQANSIGELANAAINSNPLSKLKALNKSLMSESNLLAAVRESMENTNLILKSLDQPEWIESINKINHLSIKVFDQNDAYSQLIENIESLSKLYKFEAFNSIGSLRNSPLNRFSELVESTFTHSKDIYNIHKLVDDINTEIAQTDDFEKLPATVQNKIFHFLNCVFLTICLNLFSSFLYEQIISLAKVLQPLTQSSEIKSFARNASAHYDRDLLSSFRVIIGKNVNLRASPSMSSDVILQLNIGTLVEVLDKSDRAWLLVEISDGDDIIQGWVARRYTTYFK